MYTYYCNGKDALRVEQVKKAVEVMGDYLRAKGKTTFTAKEFEQVCKYKKMASLMGLRDLGIVRIEHEEPITIKLSHDGVVYQDCVVDDNDNVIMRWNEYQWMNSVAKKALAKALNNGKELQRKYTSYNTIDAVRYHFFIDDNAFNRYVEKRISGCLSAVDRQMRELKKKMEKLDARRQALMVSTI